MGTVCYAIIALLQVCVCMCVCMCVCVCVCVIMCAFLGAVNEVGVAITYGHVCNSCIKMEQHRKSSMHLSGGKDGQSKH